MEQKKQVKRTTTVFRDVTNFETNLPKGNWTKQLKSIPSNFSEQAINKHHESNNRKSKKHKVKGYRMFKAKRVTNVFVSPDQLKGMTHVKSKVHASYKAHKLYFVHLIMDSKSGEIIKGSCNCKTGKCGVCCHVATTAWFILDCLMEQLKFVPNDLSPTEIAQKWGKLDVKKTLSTSRFSVLNFLNHMPGKKERKKLPRKICVASYSSSTQEAPQSEKKEQIKCLADDFKALKIRPMWQRILEEASFNPLEFVPVCYANESHQIPDDFPNNTIQVQRIGLPVQLINAVFENVEIELPDSLKLSLEDARVLEENTREQASSQLWKAERKERITASNFGQIVKRKAKVTDKFVESLRGGVDISRIKYVREGLQNEAVARKKYLAEKDHKVQVFKVGLVVNPGFPVLGASPDGLIYDELTQEFGLLEIKTLSKAKELGVTIDEVITRKDLKMNCCLKKRQIWNHIFKQDA